MEVRWEMRRARGVVDAGLWGVGALGEAGLEEWLGFGSVQEGPLLTQPGFTRSADGMLQCRGKCA